MEINYSHEIVEEVYTAEFGTLKSKSDEEIVKRALVKVWTEILEKYARPGCPIPPTHEVRHELIDRGVAAAIKALGKEHWYLPPSTKKKVERKVVEGLDKIDLEGFLMDIQAAQVNPALLDHLRALIRHSVLNA